MTFQDEDMIKAQLRALTQQTRKLREELRAMLASGSSADPTRSLTTPKAAKVALADDKPRSKPRRRSGR